MNRSLTYILLLGLTLVALAGCSKNADVGGRGAPPTAIAANGGSALTTAPAPASPRDLAVTVDTSVTVDHVDDAVLAVRREVEAEGGWLGRATVAGDGDERRADLEAHVPKSSLGALRGVVQEQGEVTRDVESVEDVTEARADVKARLHAARIEEARLLELTQDRTGKLSEVLETEKELSRVRENIEKIEAEERTMDGRVAYATVSLHVATRAVPVWRTPGKSIARAAVAGVHAAAALAVGTGMVLAATGPTLVPVGLVVLGIVVVFRRRSRRAAEALARG
jgi:hypothetical protein